MRPRVRGDINPTVVVSSRLSGMLKPLLLFKMSSIRASSSLPRVRIEERGTENPAQISVHIQHPHSLLDSVPAVFHWRGHTLPPLLCLPRAAVLASHRSSGRWDSLAGWHRLLSCHCSAAPVAPYVRASARTLFMLWRTL